MPTSNQQQQLDKSGIERHFQSFALALITAGVLFMGSFVVGAKEEAAATRERLAGMSQQIAIVQQQLSAMQANYVTREEWRDHETRIRQAEAIERRQAAQRGAR